MRDCANCFHRKPVLKEDGTWTAECEKWDCEFQSRENMVEKTEAKQDDLISREALLEQVNENKEIFESERVYLEGLILNAPAVEDVNPDYQIKVNIPEEETQKLIEELQRCRPCILPEDDDILKLIKENFNIGYEMAKNKYARPQGEWMVTAEDNDGVHRICCPFCRYEKGSNNTDPIIVTFSNFPKFCENCGADMRGEEK